MMTLQFRIKDHVFTGSDSSVALARARERRVFLYWHVNGLDAFHCLGRKQISLIPDKDASDRDSLPSTRRGTSSTPSLNSQCLPEEFCNGCEVTRQNVVALSPAMWMTHTHIPSMEESYLSPSFAQIWIKSGDGDDLRKYCGSLN